MRVQAKKAGDTLVVVVTGEFDLHAAEPFKQTVTDAFSRDRSLRHLVVSLRDVPFMDSSGVGAILGRYRDLKESGGSVAVVGLQTPVRRVFEFSGMGRVIPVYESEGEALARL